MGMDSERDIGELRINSKGTVIHNPDPKLSYKAFAVSGDYSKKGEPLQKQLFGYLLKRREGVAFSTGEPTPETDAALNPVGAGEDIKYYGDAYLGDELNNTLHRGISEFKANFATKVLTGSLKFYERRGKNTNAERTFTFEDDKNPTIKGNTFEIKGNDTESFFGSKIVAKGQFYGEGAREMGGLFYVKNSDESGSFGAIKQSAINPPAKPDLEGVALQHIAGKTPVKISVSNISGTSNKPAFTAGNEKINIDDLHQLIQKNGRKNPGIDPSYTEKSYKSFAVAEYDKMAYGYIYGKYNGISKDDKNTIVFSIGEQTKADDEIFTNPPSGKVKYEGEAFIGKGGEDILRGTSKFEADFANKKRLSAELQFKNTPKLNPNEQGNADIVEGPITFDLSIRRDASFGGIDDVYINDVGRLELEAEGQFYGEGAKELGGTFKIGSYGDDIYSGSFGATKNP